MIEISTSGQGSFKSEIFFQTDEAYVSIEKNDFFGKVIASPSHYSFYTQEPITISKEINLNRHLAVSDLASFQNEVSGVSINIENNRLQSFIIFSAKISRSRLYYLIKGESIYLSYDLRKLLPYSERRLRREVAYGIIKFGETPEYYTIVEDIFCVPGGKYLRGTFGALTQYILRGKIPEDDFESYFQIQYSLKGGNIISTEHTLKSVLRLLEPKSPGLLVSGGIDSALLNFLFNEVTDRPYQAIFFHFNEAPEEYEYARRSLQNTKAEFMPVTIVEKNIKRDFLESIEALIYPVYDNGSAFVGYQFHKQFLGQNGMDSDHPFVDGTLADSCYGVRNYNVKLKSGRTQSEFLSYFKEWIYSQFLLRGIKLSQTRPRDSFLHDEFLQDLLWYGGTFVNTLFPQAKSYTRDLKSMYYRYIDFLHPDNRSEYWPVYTILKMLLYAGKQTTVKTYDMFLPFQVYYPFMFTSVLEDQGTYTWQEKSLDSVIKAPLKKILEKYIDRSFIYREKVGLQSQTKRWLMSNEVRPCILSLLERKDGLAELMMGKSSAKLLTKAFKREKPPSDIVSIALSLSVMQYWCDVYGIGIKA